MSPINCIIIPIGVCHDVTKSHEVGHKMAKPAVGGMVRKYQRYSGSVVLVCGELKWEYRLGNL